jgi:hypothetical protein
MTPSRALPAAQAPAHAYGRLLSGRAAIAPLTLAAISYPFWLARFHASVDRSTGLWPAAPWLVLAFSVPLIGFGFAVWLSRPDAPSDTAIVAARRFAYLVVAAPTLFVFMGVLNSIAKTPVPDPWLWTAAWITIGLLSALSPGRDGQSAGQGLKRWRIAHGVSALILVLFVLFHLGNHLMGLGGPDLHKAVMKLGRGVYRSRFVEPLLVAAFLFQVVTGLRLAWRWSGQKADGFRVFQVASGAYLALFVLGHMNSVFVYARTLLKIDTGWSFAVGGSAGMMRDAWNIRLLPHYGLGVFLVLGHLAAGLRLVLLAHGVARPLANATYFAGLAVSFAVATAILLGMGGVRI